MGVGPATRHLVQLLVGCFDLILAWAAVEAGRCGGAVGPAALAASGVFGKLSGGYLRGVCAPDDGAGPFRRGCLPADAGRVAGPRCCVGAGYATG